MRKKFILVLCLCVAISSFSACSEERENNSPKVEEKKATRQVTEPVIEKEDPVKEEELMGFWCKETNSSSIMVFPGGGEVSIVSLESGNGETAEYEIIDNDIYMYFSARTQILYDATVEDGELVYIGESGATNKWRRMTEEEMDYLNEWLVNRT